MAELPSQIGGLLRAAREAAGLSQAAAARELGVDSVTLSRWERGKHQPPSDALVTAARLYRKPLSFFGADADRLGESVPRGTSRRQPVAQQDGAAVYEAEPRHLRNLPLEVRVYLDELRLKLTKGGASEEEVDRAMALLRRPSIFSWYSVGTPKDLSPAKILQTMKAITDSAILPYLREQGRKV